MKYWPEIKDRLKDHTELAIQLLLLTLGAYIFIMSEKYRLWKIPVLFFGLLAWFLFRNKTKHPIIWIAFFTLLVFDLYYQYLRVANHHFMILFMVLSVIFYMYHKRSDILQKNIQMLLVVVLMASVAQKLMSSQFMSGDFYYYMFNRGSLYGVFLKFFPESLAIAKSNAESFITLQDSDPNNAKSIVVKDIFSNLPIISLVFAWFTVVMEFIVALVILWKPKSIWTQLLFSLLILGILCTRLETGFMALLGICGLFLSTNIKFRLYYLIVVSACITLIVTRLGYH